MVVVSKSLPALCDWDCAKQPGKGSNAVGGGLIPYSEKQWLINKNRDGRIKTRGSSYGVGSQSSVGSLGGVDRNQLTPSESYVAREARQDH